MGYLDLERRGVMVPKERYCNSYGIHVFYDSNGFKYNAVSAETWEDYWCSVCNINDSNSFVVSPELITCAGEEFGEISKLEVEKKISDVLLLSESLPLQTFVLGTPLFVNIGKPRNGVLIIKNGEILDYGYKRAGATEEENYYFEMVPDSPPLLLPGTKTSVVICSDLVLASMYCGNMEMLDDVLRLSGRKELVGVNVEVLVPEAQTVLLLSCWSVGSKFVPAGKADEYYRMQLTNTSWRIMRETEVKEVIVVDRLPINLSPELEVVTPKQPLSGVIRL